MDTSLEVPRLGGVTEAAKPPKTKAVADGAHPPAMRQRTDWPFVSDMSRYAHPRERVILRGGGNSAPAKTASTRTVRLFRTE